jgi:hypothetical protein
MLRQFVKKAIFSRRFSTAAPIFNFSEEENALRDAGKLFLLYFLDFLLVNSAFFGPF